MTSKKIFGKNIDAIQKIYVHLSIQSLSGYFRNIRRILNLLFLILILIIFLNLHIN